MNRRHDDGAVCKVLPRWCVIIELMFNEEILDRLRNVLTGIAVNSGVLKREVKTSRFRTKLEELEALSLEAVSLLRQIAPG